MQMELVEGLSLARRLDDLRRLPEDEARFYAGCVGSVEGQGWERGVCVCVQCHFFFAAIRVCL